MPTIAEVLAPLLHASSAPRRRVFLSYHHARDQAYYDAFSRLFHDTYETIFDNSVDRRIDSHDPEYQMRRIRDTYITGTSCTIVLCGAETPWRKFVDWEIKTTLEKAHGLLGIRLPSAVLNAAGNWYAPDRLVDNISPGYATWETWEAVSAAGPANLTRLVEAANARPTGLISNSRPMMGRNGIPPWQR